MYSITRLNVKEFAFGSLRSKLQEKTKCLRSFLTSFWLIALFPWGADDTVTIYWLCYWVAPPSRNMCLQYESCPYWRARLFCFFFTVGCLLHGKLLFSGKGRLLSKTFSEEPENVLYISPLIKLDPKFCYLGQILAPGNHSFLFCSLKECLTGGRTAIVWYLLYPRKCSEHASPPKVFLLFIFPFSSYS